MAQPEIPWRVRFSPWFIGKECCCSGSRRSHTSRLVDAVGGDLGIGAGGEWLCLFLLLFSGGPFFVLPFWVGGYGVLSGLVGLEQGDG